MSHIVAAMSRQNVFRVLLISVFLMVCTATGFAQYNPTFDSSVRSAMSIADPAARLTILRSLTNQAEASSVFQMLAYGKDFLTAANEVGSDTDQYSAHSILSAGYERNRDFQQAVSHSLKAIGIADKRKDYLSQIRAFQGLAFTYSSMGLLSGDKADMAKAFDYCDQAMKMSKEHSVQDEVPYILTTMGDVYAMNTKYDTAINLYRRAIAVRNGQGKSGTLSTYTNLAIALNLTKNYEAALAVYATADSISVVQNKGTFFRLKIASNRAILFSDMGKMRESETLAKEVLASAQQTGAIDIQVDMIEHLKNLCRKEGRYPEALSLSDTLAAIKERMFSAEKTGQVAEMQARYDAGVKDQQIIGQQNTIRQNNQLNIGLLSGLILLFIFGTAAFVGLRRSRQLNRKITIQQQELMVQKTELQRINDMKNQLFSLISHDVRVPLNSLMAYATMLDQQGELPPEKIKKYNTDLRQTLGYTTVLMENLLQFAKTQMQSIQPYPESGSLSAIVDRAVRLLQPAMIQKNITLETDFAEDDNAYADEDMTEVILRNLLSNAIKFSNEGGNIRITIIAQDAANICCTIYDDGAGMKPELAALWNDASVPAPVRSTMGTKHEKGSGLGLMLSKTFAMMMGGNLFVKSEFGKGSAFSLVLPGKNPAA